MKPGEAVPCSWCGARVGEPCTPRPRGGVGKTGLAHAGRLMRGSLHAARKRAAARERSRRQQLDLSYQQDLELGGLELVERMAAALRADPRRLEDMDADADHEAGQ